jgi:hypothetical protein
MTAKDGAAENERRPCERIHVAADATNDVRAARTKSVRNTRAGRRFVAELPSSVCWDKSPVAIWTASESSHAFA